MHSDSPFGRTSVIITAIIAAVILFGGIVAISALSPDAGPRINSVLTITIPIFLISIVNVGIAVRNGRMVQATRNTMNTVQSQTNGITSKLLAHALGETTLDTSELKVIAQKADDNAKQGGQ